MKCKEGGGASNAGLKAGRLVVLKLERRQVEEFLQQLDGQKRQIKKETGE